MPRSTMPRCRASAISRHQEPCTACLPDLSCHAGCLPLSLPVSNHLKHYTNAPGMQWNVTISKEELSGRPGGPAGGRGRGRGRGSQSRNTAERPLPPPACRQASPACTQDVAEHSRLHVLASQADVDKTKPVQPLPLLACSNLCIQGGTSQAGFQAWKWQAGLKHSSGNLLAWQVACWTGLVVSTSVQLPMA